jgi:hypothetical protein
MQKLLLRAKAVIDQLPHWLILAITTALAAAFMFFQAEPTTTLVSALTSWTQLRPILLGAVGVFFATLVGILKTAPWSSGTAVVEVSGDATVRRVVPKVPPLACLALGLLLVFGVAACGLFSPTTWAAVVTDLATIAQTVLADVLAGKPFAQVLADTGQEDATLLVTVLTGLIADPKTTPAYVAACQPYLVAAQALQAKQSAARAAHQPIPTVP